MYVEALVGCSPGAQEGLSPAPSPQSPSDGMVSCTNQSKQVWFELQYKEQQVTLKAVDGRYVALRPNGQILLLPEGAGMKLGPWGQEVRGCLSAGERRDYGGPCSRSGGGSNPCQAGVCKPKHEGLGCYPAAHCHLQPRPTLAVGGLPAPAGQGGAARRGQHRLGPACSVMRACLVQQQCQGPRVPSGFTLSALGAPLLLAGELGCAPSPPFPCWPCIKLHMMWHFQALWPLPHAPSRPVQAVRANLCLQARRRSSCCCW